MPIERDLHIHFEAHAHAKSAVNGDILAGDERGFVADKKQRKPGYFFRSTYPAQRSHFNPALKCGVIRFARIMP